MELSKLSAAALRRAAAVKDKIQSLENELFKILESGGLSGRSGVLRTVGKVERKRRNLSAAARAKMAAAARARWAKIKAATKK